MAWMRATRGVVIALTVMCIAFVGGCKKKTKHQPVTPPPLPVAVQAEPQRPPSMLAKTLPEPVPPPPPLAQNTAPTKPRVKPKPSHKQPATAKKGAEPNGTHPTTTIAQNTPPPKITIQQGSVPELSGIIIATMPHTDEMHAKLTTDQLLQSTDENLRAIKRTLNNDEQALVGQIKNFIAQAKSATEESDFMRARNLALKAHLLSDELLRR